MKEVVYAVYRCQGGRWTRDRSYSAEQRDEAKKAAEGLLARQGVQGVTLVRETFVPETGATEEIGIWAKNNPNQTVPALGVTMRQKEEPQAEKAAPKAEEEPEDKGGGEGDDIPVLVSPGVKPVPAGSPFLVVFKLTTALLTAGVVAGGISYVLARFDLYGMFTFVLDRQGIQGKVFGGLFVLALLVVLPNVLTWREFATAFSVAPAGGARRPAPRRAAPPRKEGPKAEKENATADKKAQPEKAGDQPQAANGKTTPQAQQQPTAPAPPPEPEGPEVVEAKKSIMTFFSRCVEFLMKTSSQFLKGGKLSAYNHFGCDLFLAGAAEAYAERKAMPEKGKEIMAAVIRAAGRANDRASQFAEKHENYLLEPRYLDMFRAGREAMTIFLKDEELRAKAASGELTEDDEAAMAGEAEGDIGIFLENALDHWNAGSDGGKPKTGGTVAVMFTAIIGGFTEAVGDEMTAKMLHTHNRIVRESLRRFGGNEIKQTNEGIMASFPQASQAVEAAIEIQRGAKTHTGNSPDVPLHMRIGINAGEPIAENNDLFGTPVQLAARVCAYAGQDQIAVSKLVHDLCSGKGLQFRDLGTAEFKGFGEKMPVYEAQWRDESEMLPE